MGQRMGTTNRVQSLHIFHAVKLVMLRGLAVIHLPNSFVTVLLQVGPVGEVAGDPAEGVAEVETSSNC